MKRKIFVATPSIGDIVDSQSYALRKMAEHYKDHVEFVYPAQCVRRKMHDFARNMMVEEFLETDCEAMWFLDSDITPSEFTLDLVALHWDDWSLAGLTYPVFMEVPNSGIPGVIYTAYDRNPETGAFALRNVPREGIEFIDGLATGCLFIKREVFSKLEKPYFEFKYDGETRNLIEGEDLGFCRKVNDLGYKFMVDFSLHCKHEKRVDLLDVNNYAIDYANRSVMTYDAQIKEQIQKAIAASYQKGKADAAKELAQIVRKTEQAQTGLIAPDKTLWVPR